MTPFSPRTRAARAPLPTAVVLLALVGACALTLPLVGLGSRVSWGELPRLLGSESARSALLLSLRTCLVSTAACVVLGVPLALVLARQWPGVRLARILAVLPMTMPPVVAGIALLSTLGRRGLLGARLEAWGLGLAFSTAAVVVAQVFVSLPYLVVTLEAALRSRDTRVETVARTLGASPWRVLAGVTLPLVAPALARGTALALGRSLGEFGATIAFAGSREGVTRTMPLAIYLEREADTATALALAVVLVAVSFVVVGATTLRWDRLVAAAWGRRGASGTQDGWTSPETGAARAQPARGASLSPPTVPGSAPSPDGAWAPDVPPVPEDASLLPGPPSPTGIPSSDRQPAQAAGGAEGASSKGAGGAASPEKPGACSRGEDLEVAFSSTRRDVVVDLLARAGRVTALLGPNGSGKSTVCSVAAGLLDATGGRVRLGGRVLDGPEGFVAAGRREVALLSQAPTLFPHMSVLDNVAFGPRCQGLTRAEARSRALAELDAVGAAHLAARPGGGLSGGQAARVALARALATRPRVLVLDEPTAALDVVARQEMRHLVSRRAQEEGLTVLLVTHDVLDVVALAHDVVVLERGRVVERGGAAQVLSRPGSDFTAHLTGTAVLTGTLSGSPQAPALELETGPASLPAAGPAGPPGSAPGPEAGASRATKPVRWAGAGPGRAHAAGPDRAARQIHQATASQDHEQLDHEPADQPDRATDHVHQATANLDPGPADQPDRATVPGTAAPSADGPGLRVVVHGRPEEAADGFRPGLAGVALVPPDAVALYRSAPHGSPRNVLGGVVTSLERAGALVSVDLEVAPGQRLRATVTAGAVADLGIEPGQGLWAVVKAVEVRIVARRAPAGPGTGAALGDDEDVEMAMGTGRTRKPGTTKEDTEDKEDTA